MKTKEELNALKNAVEDLNAKLTELSEDELRLVIGGFDTDYDIIWKKSGDEVQSPINVGDYTATITYR